jgi:hypothetical protein
MVCGGAGEYLIRTEVCAVGIPAIGLGRGIVPLLLVVMWGLSCEAAADSRLRVVPQLAWAPEGRRDPEGTWHVSWGHRQHSVRLIDARRSALAWSIPLWQPHDAVFSPDGRWLAACGADRGLLLDLRSGKLRYLPQFRGQLAAFTPDAKRLLVVRRASYRVAAQGEPDDDGLYLFDLEGRQLARYAVRMSVPQVVDFLKGGRMVRLRGLYGNPMMRVLRMGSAEQFVDLQTGNTEHNQGPIQRGRPAAPEDPTRVKLPQPTQQKRVAQRSEELHWDEAGGTCVQFGSCVPEGGVAKAWDVRGGRFLGTLGYGISGRQIGGFVGPATLLANAWEHGECHLSQIDVRNGQITPTRLPAAVSLPAPSGKHLVAHVGWANTREQWWELHTLPPAEPLYRAKLDRRKVRPLAWSRQGRYFVRSRRTGPDAGLTLIRARDGKTDEIKLGELLAKHTVREGWDLKIWCLDLDEEAGQLAVGVGEPKLGMVLVMRLADRQIETVLEGFPGCPAALRFVADDRLLVGHRRGAVQLWNLQAREPLWTTETQEDLLQFDFVPGGEYLVGGHLFRSASVLRLEDGKLLRKTRPLLGGDSPVPLPWINPKLIGSGRLALEMDPESLQVRLVETGSGRILLTYCGMPEDQWIVYTPQGDWDGSAGIHEWVRFYDGLRAVEAAAADRRRSPAQIAAVLEAAFDGERKSAPQP